MEEAVARERAEAGKAEKARQLLKKKLAAMERTVSGASRKLTTTKTTASAVAGTGTIYAVVTSQVDAASEARPTPIRR